jgi:hypothetical protein
MLLLFGRLVPRTLFSVSMMGGALEAGQAGTTAANPPGFPKCSQGIPHILYGPLKCLVHAVSI